MKKIGCILLIDDNPADYFLHRKIIETSELCSHTIDFLDAKAALDYLFRPEATDYMEPDIIFLDINMPGMDGWQFIDRYQKLNDGLRKSMIVVMLSTSLNPDDHLRAQENYHIRTFLNKPLTKESLNNIIEENF
ncbi:MAG: response regulator [Bacteroidota bacterium]